MPHHYRIKIQLHGTKQANYLGGEHEGKRGRITAGTKAPQGYEQTATVLFEDGERRSIVARFIEPVHPTAIDEDVLVAAGENKGSLMVVRELDDDMCTISSKANPARVFSVSREVLVSLYDDQ